jgi:hypothetical protein
MAKLRSAEDIAIAKTIDALSNPNGRSIERRQRAEWLRLLAGRGFLKRLAQSTDGRRYDITDRGREFADEVLGRRRPKALGRGAATHSKASPNRGGSGAITDRWRYLAVKRGSAFYLTELSPERSAAGKRLFRVPGRRIVFKHGSTVPEKVYEAFASAVKTAP